MCRQCIVLVDGEVRDAHPSDFSGPLEGVENIRELAGVREQVRAMDLPQVDALNTESGEGSIDRLLEVGRAGVIGERRADSTLGREDHALAQGRGRLQHLTEIGFALAERGAPVIEAVDVRGINQVHSSIERSFDQSGVAAGVVRGEAPGAERKRADGGPIGAELTRRTIEEVLGHRLAK